MFFEFTKPFLFVDEALAPENPEVGDVGFPPNEELVRRLAK